MPWLLVVLSADMAGQVCALYIAHLMVRKLILLFEVHGSAWKCIIMAPMHVGMRAVSFEYADPNNMVIASRHKPWLVTAGRLPQ